MPSDWRSKLRTQYGRSKAFRRLWELLTGTWTGIAAVLRALTLLAAGGGIAYAGVHAVWPSIGDEPTTSPAIASVPFLTSIAEICDSAREDNANAVRLGQSLVTAFKKAGSEADARRAATRTLAQLANRADDLTARFDALKPPKDVEESYRRASQAMNRNADRMRWYSNALAGAQSPQVVTTVLIAARHKSGAAARDRKIARTELIALGGAVCNIGKTLTIDPILAPKFFAAPANDPRQKSTGSGRPSTAVPESTSSAPATGTKSSAKRKPGKGSPSGGDADSSTGKDKKAGDPDDVEGRQGEQTTTTGSTTVQEQELPILPSQAGSPSSGDGIGRTVPTTTTESNTTTPQTTPQIAPSGTLEVTGGMAHTWSNYTNASGTPGPTIPSYAQVLITCRVEGFRVADGNTWWYRISSSPWNDQFYVSADAFYNNGQTSGSLHGTPFVDPAVPGC